MKIEPRILLFKGRGIVSRLIRFQTRSHYSHSAILMPNGEIIESWQGKGVRIKRLNDWKDIDAYKVPAATSYDWEDIIDYCNSQIGAKYDYSSVFHFVTRTKETQSSQDKWFCSELVAEAFVQVGIPLLHVDPSEVSPRDLSISPLLFKARSYYENGK